MKNNIYAGVVTKDTVQNQSFVGTNQYIQVNVDLVVSHVTNSLLKCRIYIHMSSFTPDKKNFRVTHDCGKQCRRGSHLRQHELVHTNERRFVCNVCVKRLSSASSLHQHELHTGEKGFICQICNKIFARASDLKSHQQTHSNERKYVCLSCNKRFKRTRNLNKHMRYHCTKRWEQTEMRHVTNVKQTKCTVYVCCECNQLFVNKFDSFKLLIKSSNVSCRLGVSLSLSYNVYIFM